MERVGKAIAIIILVVVAAGCLTDQAGHQIIPAEPEIPTRYPLTPVPAPAEYLRPVNASHISRVWANEGGDKVTREELRASRDPAAVLNSVWDGTAISVFGAKNEIISFNLILEAAAHTAREVRVAISDLQGPGGYTLNYLDPSREDLYDFTRGEIELFYTRYLQIKGLSTDLFFAGYNYDERHIPERCRRPLNADGEGMGGWEDRPCHDRFYPDIAVPLHLESPFDVQSGNSQSIWGDIYIPSDAPAGEYQGTIFLQEGELTTWEIPVHLEVLDFELPALPGARTMVYISRENLTEAYLGDLEELDQSPSIQEIIDRHFFLAHRHKISLIDSYLAPEEMAQAWLDKLSGALFTERNGYAGPGQGIGNNVYSIGTYGDWPWMGENRQQMYQETDRWVEWFQNQDLKTPTDVFLYLIDETDNYRLVEKWAGWMNENPGPGGDLLSLATMDLPIAVEKVPSLDIPASWAHFGLPSEWQTAAAQYRERPDKRLFLYNSNRPATGSFAIEDEGTALRQIAWVQYKMGVERWFYWESTYYNNFQCYGDDSEAVTNVYQKAQTYGCLEEFDPSLGETGWNYLNGDGVLFYPGTDVRFPADNYGIAGPFASYRLKAWRRGIQDVDYLILAAEVDPKATDELVQRMIPAVLWELGVEDPEDPTYLYTDISWAPDPDYWESARAELADIILSVR